MAGLKISLSSNFTDASMPILYDDFIMSSGSLMLIDPSHSANPLIGVPANGATIPNIAWNSAKNIIGSGTVSSLACSFSDQHQAADALFERTAKGALHGIYSQVTNTNGNRGASIVVPSLVQTYLFNNVGNRFYMSVWGNRTRIANTAGGVSPRMAQIAVSGNPGNRIILMDTGGTSGTAQTGNRQIPGANTAGNFVKSVDGLGFGAGAPANAGLIDAKMFMWGNTPPGESAWSNKCPSDVLYRVYLEDLTVSGRTYAQVDAIDYTLYQTAFSVGGRFYGDTYTNPSTFA